MKFIVTGSLGNISKALTQILVKNGHDVTVVSSNVKKIAQVEAFGAKAAIGSVEDVGFLIDVFKGADGIYTMVPPNWGVDKYREYIGNIGGNYREAIQASGVKRVVNLSSVGADLNGGTGSIAGLHDVEQMLNKLDGVSIRHLRAGLFFTNFFFDIGAIRAMGIMGNNYGGSTKLPIVHPQDIAGAAAQELGGSFEGKSHRYVVGEERKVSDIVKVLGVSIGKPGLDWVQFSDEETFAGMIGAGMSKTIADIYVEMGHAIDSGVLFEDFRKHKPEVWGPTKLTDFVNEFAAVYNSGA